MCGDGHAEPALGGQGANRSKTGAGVSRAWMCVRVYGAMADMT
ncbi:hypothetical protein LG3211_0571 [Lysobacter gummosus]|nr:hypothetical protein LG3211_0571 [Lysobacter gummosus]